MEKLKDIKNEYAKEMGFDDWNHLKAKIMFESKGFSIALNTIILHNDEVTKLYAEECCIKTLEEASLNACIEPKGMMTRVDKASITDPDNIVLL